MKFIKKILEKIEFLALKKHIRYIIIEETDYSLKLQSKFLLIMIVYNKFENSHILWLGKNDAKSDMIKIDNNALTDFFFSELKLSQVPEDVFINNIMSFFTNEAKPLLNGDVVLIDKLEKFDLERSRRYTRDLITKQNLIAINKAWDIKDYNEFVRRMDQIDKSSLPSSYELKYKIAKQKL